MAGIRNGASGGSSNDNISPSSGQIILFFFLFQMLRIAYNKLAIPAVAIRNRVRSHLSILANVNS